MNEKMTEYLPLDSCVTIEVEKVKSQSGGGIILTDETVDRDQLSASEGKIVQVGDGAFDYLIDNKARYPKIGDSVLFKRFSGITHTDPDTKVVYRVIADKDIYVYKPKKGDD